MTISCNNNNLLWSHTAAILAGGESKRMGTPKEGIPLWDSRPMIEHIVNTISIITKKIVIVGECKGYSPTKDIKIIPDFEPHRGPLIGLKSLLKSNLDSAYLVIACDQPLITKELLQLLIQEESQHIKLFTGEKLEARIDPFPGYYPTSCLKNLQNMIEIGNSSMQAFLKSSKIDWIKIPEDQKHLLRSINTPQDLEEVKNEFAYR